MTLKELKETLGELPENLENMDVVFGMCYPTMDVETIEVVTGQIEIGM